MAENKDKVTFLDRWAGLKAEFGKIVWPDGKINFAFTHASNTSFTDRGTAISTQSLQRWAEGGSRAHTAGHGDGTHSHPEQLVNPEKTGKANANKILHHKESYCADGENQTQLAAFLQYSKAAGKAGAGEEQIHKEVLESAVHLHREGICLDANENENAADQATDDRCGNKVLLEKLDFAFDAAAEQEYQHGKAYSLDDVEFDDHGKCLLYLFRGVLLEQIYRSFKIINNESYHK